MSLTKVNYIDKETVITAQNLNDIQDSIINLEGSIGAIPFADERPEGLAANSLWFDTTDQNSGLAIQVIDEKYAIGDIFITTRHGDPNALLGYGSWSQIKDRFLLAAGDSYVAGDTGGEVEHTLTVDEMPSHTHVVSNYLSNVGWSGSSPSSSYLNNIDDGHVGSNNPISQSTGGNQAHNNMPPYLVVYMWLRTA